jgi:excisionase family DNA binding protein
MASRNKRLPLGVSVGVKQQVKRSVVGARAATAVVEPFEELLSIRDVMRILGVSRRTIYNLMSREGLPVLRVGRSVRFNPCLFRRWMSEREQVA